MLCNTLGISGKVNFKSLLHTSICILFQLANESLVFSFFWKQCLAFKIWSADLVVVQPKKNYYFWVLLFSLRLYQGQSQLQQFLQYKVFELRSGTWSNNIKTSRPSLHLYWQCTSSPQAFVAAKYSINHREVPQYLQWGSVRALWIW